MSWRSWTDGEIGEALARFVDEYGRTPTALELNAPNGAVPSKNTLVRRFGSLGKAYQHFGFEGRRSGTKVGQVAWSRESREPIVWGRRGVTEDR